MQGKVKWFSTEKGYGYIVGQDGQDYYFHVRDVQGEYLPKNGDSATFTAKDGNKGPRAFSVNIIDKAPTPSNNSSKDDRVVCSSCNKKNGAENDYTKRSPVLLSLPLLRNSAPKLYQFRMLYSNSCLRKL